jgi:hypothetical protein
MYVLCTGWSSREVESLQAYSKNTVFQCNDRFTRKLWQPFFGTEQPCKKQRLLSVAVGAYAKLT